MDWKDDLHRTHREVDRRLAMTFRDAERKLGAVHASSRTFVRLAREFVLRGKSKRIRPYLVVLGYAATGKRPVAGLYDVGAAIECFHNALLVHDDIIDHGDTRRGGPTVHISGRVFANHASPALRDHIGVTVGILAGNLLNAIGSRLFINAGFTPGSLRKALDMYQDVLETTNAGELLDVLVTVAEKPKRADVAIVNAMKTARYSFEGPLVAGGMLGGASETQLALFRKIALPLGVAFQLTDDHLGVFGSSSRIGKSVLSDIREGKVTLLMLETVRRATTSQRKTLRCIVGNSRATMTDLRVVRSIMRACGAVDVVDRERNVAIDSVDRILARSRVIDPAVSNVIQSLGHHVISRSH